MRELTWGCLPRTRYAKNRNAVKRWGLAPSQWDPPGTSPRYARGSSAAIEIAKETKTQVTSNGIPCPAFSFAASVRLQTWKPLLSTLTWPEEGRASYPICLSGTAILGWVMGLVGKK